MKLNVVQKIDNLVEIRNIIVSVSDKSGLKSFISQMLEINPGITIYSTGGTFDHIHEFLGDRADAYLKQVSQYTGQPETQGGLVKTLDFKIYLGILTETYNTAHQKDLVRAHAVPMDMVVVNLYPFQETIAAPGATVEHARGNIDIGGPCMIRASAKNFIRVLPVVDPQDYPEIVSEIRVLNGFTSLDLRFRMAQKAFRHTATYDAVIAEYLGSQNLSDVKNCYPSNPE